MLGKLPAGSAPLNVLMVVRDAVAVGGLETSITKLAPALEELQVYPNALVVDALPGGASERVLAAAMPTSVARDEGGGSAAAAAAKIVEADVVHVHAADLLALPRRLMRSAHRLGRPVVVTIHLPGYPPLGPVSPGWFRTRASFLVTGAFLRFLGSTVAAPSPSSAATAAARYGHVVRVRTLRNGITDPGARPVPDVDDALHVALVGRLDHHKRPLTIVEAASAARRRGVRVHLHVVGEGPLAPEVESRGAELGIGDALTMYGQLRDPSEVVARSHVLALASHVEGCPMVAIEAAALGRGVVARAGLDGLGEMWGAGAVMVPADAGPTEFGDAFVRLAQSHGEASAAGAAARRAYEAWFTAAAAAQQWTEAYLAAIGAARRPA